MEARGKLRRMAYLAWKWGLAGGLVYLFLGFLTSRLSRDPLSLDLPAEGPRGVAQAVQGSGSNAAVTAPDFRFRYPVSSPGALSVHSGRSHDAEGSLEEVAAAAVNTDLDWLVLGDHPRDWALEPGVFEPRRIDGVQLSLGAEMVIEESGRTLVVGLDSVPRSWNDGLPGMAELARSAGGFTSIVHARSPSYGESWKVPSVEGADAFEAFDVSEMARHRLASIWMPYHLASLAVGIPTRRMDESLIRLWRERSATPALLAYDSLRATTHIALTGGLNHHPKARLRGAPFPAYEPFFRTVVNHLHLTDELPIDPGAAQLVLAEAIRSGRLYVSLGWPDQVGPFAFWGLDGAADEAMADPMILPGEVRSLSGSSRLIVDLPRVRNTELLIRLIRDGQTVDWVATSGTPRVEWTITQPGVYRLEVHRAGIDLGPLRLGLTPWLFSNPIEFTR